MHTLAGDDDAGVRRIAIRAIAKRSGGTATLRDALDDASLPVRIEAAEGLLTRGDARGAGVLVAALADPLLAKRARLALAGRDIALPALLAALEHEAIEVRNGAAWLLGYGTGQRERVIAALRALDPGEPEMLLATTDALSRLGDRAVTGALRELATEPRYSINAARAMARFNHREAYDALFAIAASDAFPARARHIAARSLALGDEAAAAHLRALLDSDDLRVRRLAASGLSRF